MGQPANRYFEYAVSHGPGTLLEHGFATLAEIYNGSLVWAQMYTMIIEPARRMPEEGERKQK